MIQAVLRPAWVADADSMHRWNVRLAFLEPSRGDQDGGGAAVLETDVSPHAYCGIWFVIHQFIHGFAAVGHLPFDRTALTFVVQEKFQLTFGSP